VIGVEDLCPNWPNSGTFLITPAHVAVESFSFDKRMATASAMTEASVSRRGSVCDRGPQPPEVSGFGTGGTVYRSIPSRYSISRSS